MEGIRYKYKLTKRHTSYRAVYEPRISKDKEDKSIENIQVLQREKCTTTIYPTPSELENPKKIYFSLNSTSLRTNCNREKRIRE
jgi:hypothetical protein